MHKLFLKNVGGFGLAPSPIGSGLKLAAWVPEGKGAPGFVGIWDVASLGKAQDTPAPVARRSFFRVRAACPHGPVYMLAAPQDDCQLCLHGRLLNKTHHKQQHAGRLRLT